MEIRDNIFSLVQISDAFIYFLFYLNWINQGEFEMYLYKSSENIYKEMHLKALKHTHYPNISKKIQ